MPARNPLATFINRILTTETADAHLTAEYPFFENFVLLPLAAQTAVSTNQNFDLTGTGTPSAPQLNASVTGQSGVNLTTTNVSSDSSQLFPVAASIWGTTFPPTANITSRFEAMVRVPATITTMQIYVGLKLTDTPVPATDNDQVLFVYDTSNTTLNPTNLTANANWNVIDSVANTDTATNTGLAVTASTNYRLTITLGTDSRARCYINGNLVRTTAVLTTAAALIPTCGVVTRGAVVRTLGVRWFRATRTYA